MFLVLLKIDTQWILQEQLNLSQNMICYVHTKICFNTIISKKTEFLLFRARHTVFKSGDKAGLLFSHCTEGRPASSRQVRLGIVDLTPSKDFTSDI